MALTFSMVADSTAIFAPGGTGLVRQGTGPVLGDLEAGRQGKDGPAP